MIHIIVRSSGVAHCKGKLYVYHLEAIYGLLIWVFVAHVQCLVTSATSQKMVTVLGATVLIVQKRKKQREKFRKEGEE
jgi:hypothetical protein